MYSRKPAAGARSLLDSRPSPRDLVREAPQGLRGRGMCICICICMCIGMCICIICMCICIRVCTCDGDGGCQRADRPIESPARPRCYNPEPKAKSSVQKAAPHRRDARALTPCYQGMHRRWSK